jgi:hypothetical protein
MFPTLAGKKSSVEERSDSWRLLVRVLKELLLPNHGFATSMATPES